MKYYFFVLIAFLTVHCNGTFRPFSEPGGRIEGFSVSGSSTILSNQKYKILRKSKGQSSTLYLLGAIPVTRALNVDYALSQAVAKVPQGQNIINLKIWIEKQYFFPLGTIFRLNVEGDVIQYL